jgi:outer membrane protein assembly factor BamD
MKKNFVFPGVSIFLAFLSPLLFLTFSCSKYNKILKSQDLNLKYEAAIKYYEEKDYYKAYPLFEELTVVYRGTSKAEKLSYYFAYTDYYTGDLFMASYRFKNFTSTYPNSVYTEECLFMSAYCHYLLSPSYSLDQEDTRDAINEMQLFLNKYPQSSRADSCNKLIDDLHWKLETKAFAISKQYYKMRNYKSAIISFNNMLKDFPDTEYKEEVAFLIVKSHYYLAINSIESKKEQRIKDTIASYIKFADEFPKSDYLREAENLYENILKEKQKINSET